MREITMSQALNEALFEEMRRDPAVFVMGEDVAASGGIFGVTAGLLQEFGPQRVIDTPISEAAFTGAGVGAAIVGARPIVEIQVFDFLSLAMDQLANHAAKLRYMTGGQVKVPMVVRGPVASGIGLAAQHSQSLEAWVVHIPGLKVVMPSTPYDAKGLLKSAIRDDNPVVFFEKRVLYAQRGQVPEDEYLVPLGKAAVRREGSDVTFLGSGFSAVYGVEAAARLADEGISVEVIDLRTLKPLDADTIVASVRKTHRCVVGNDGYRTCGFAAELMATVIEHCFDYLDAPVVRVTGEDVPIPCAENLEAEVHVNTEKIARALRRVVEG